MNFVDFFKSWENWNSTVKMISVPTTEVRVFFEAGFAGMIVDDFGVVQSVFRDGTAFNAGVQPNWVIQKLVGRRFTQSRLVVAESKGFPFQIEFDTSPNAKVLYFSCSA